MKIRASDIASGAGFLSGAFILGSAVPLLAEATAALPVVGATVSGALTSLAGMLGTITPGFLVGVGAKISTFAMSIGFGIPALGVVAAIGLAVAVPWAIEMTGKLIDGAINKAESKINSFQSNTVVQKEHAHSQQEFQQEYNQLPAVPVHQHAAPAMNYTPDTPSWHPANEALERGVSFTENYLQEDKLPPSQRRMGI